MNNTPLVDGTVELVLSPAKSGAYLSKPDISGLATMVGFSIILQERKKMLEEMFRFLRSKEELLRAYEGLSTFYESKMSDYESIFGFFPSSEPVLRENYQKCIATIKKIEEFKEEVELLEFVKPEDL